MTCPWARQSILPLILVILSMAASAGGCGTGRVQRATAHYAPGTGFVRNDVEVGGRQHAVWVFVPRDYRPEQKYPAVLFLHGLFEAGGDGTRCLSAGLGPVIAKSPDEWQFITIFPQSDGTWRGPQREAVAIAALDSAMARWSIDPDRVTLAGLSFGALGTWEIGAQHRDRFAALVPVAGFRAMNVVDRLVTIPVWAFGYRGDLIAPPTASEAMCRELNDRGGNARLTAFNGIGHDGWSRAVADSDLVDWMLAQRRVAHATPKPPPPPVADATVAHVE